MPDNEQPGRRRFLVEEPSEELAELLISFSRKSVFFGRKVGRAVPKSRNPFQRPRVAALKHQTYQEKSKDVKRREKSVALVDKNDGNSSNNGEPSQSPKVAALKPVVLNQEEDKSERRKREGIDLVNQQNAVNPSNNCEPLQSPKVAPLKPVVLDQEEDKSEGRKGEEVLLVGRKKDDNPSNIGEPLQSQKVAPLEPVVLNQEEEKEGQRSKKDVALFKQINYRHSSNNGEQLQSPKIAPLKPVVLNQEQEKEGQRSKKDVVLFKQINCGNPSKNGEPLKSPKVAALEPVLVQKEKEKVEMNREEQPSHLPGQLQPPNDVQEKLKENLLATRRGNYKRSIQYLNQSRPRPEGAKATNRQNFKKSKPANAKPEFEVKYYPRIAEDRENQKRREIMKMIHPVVRERDGQSSVRFTLHLLPKRRRSVPRNM